MEKNINFRIYSKEIRSYRFVILKYIVIMVLCIPFFDTPLIRILAGVLFFLCGLGTSGCVDLIEDYKLRRSSYENAEKGI